MSKATFVAVGIVCLVVVFSAVSIALAIAESANP